MVKKNRLRDLLLRESINLRFQNGSKYSHDTGLRDGKSILFLVWLTEGDPALPNYWIKNSVVEDSIEKGFHLLSRKYGWSYSDNFEVMVPFWYRTIFSTMLILPKNSAENLFTFGREVETKFKEELPGRWWRERFILIEGMEDWGGMIIDPEKIREQRLRAKPSDVLFWRDYLAETKPAVVVVGDIES